MRKRILLYGSVGLALAMVIAGVIMLVQTFTRYNDLSLERQDNQLEEMARAADKYIAAQLNNFHEDLDYVLGRRGFVQAEAQWAETGDGTELLERMQENLVMQDPMVQTMLAMQEDRIVLSTDGRTDYIFPTGTEEMVQACLGADGTLFIAVMADTAHGRYAALIHAVNWYADYAKISAPKGGRLLLLGRQGKLLLHAWQGEYRVSAVEELDALSCDEEALRRLMQSSSRGEATFASYSLTYPGEDFMHEMRMTTIPVQAGENGYFSIGLTSDYDEIIRPAHAAVFQLIVYGGGVIAGVVLLALLLMWHIRRNDRALRQLQARNEETRKLLEKTRELAHHQRLETIGTLTASIAHEFNNLLTPIMGYSILTLEGLPEGCDDLADQVTEIYEASRKAKNIISRLSELSRKYPEAGFRELSLQEMVTKALAVMEPARPTQVQTQVCIRADNCRVTGNETQISQLLLNLILNAFQAMEEAGGTLTLAIDEKDGCALLRVEDTGAGIPAEALPHIFEPFYTTKSPGSGTGLGLAIVHQVMESHGGSLQVESAVGRGTAFTLRFPEKKTGENSVSE